MKALHVRLTLIFAGLLLGLGACLMVLLEHSSDRYADELRQRLDAGIAMYVVRELALVQNGHLNQLAVRELANRAMTVNPSAEVYLLDSAGRVMTTVVQHDRVLRREVNLQPILSFLRAPEQRPLYGDDPASRQGQRVFSVAEVRDGGKLNGYLYVVLGGGHERSIGQRLRSSYVLRAASIALAAVIIAALAVAGALFAVLTRPLRRLDRAMTDWSARMPAETARFDPPPGGADELGTLTQRFAAMSAAIERQVAELRGTDQLRRELIANVSHDLRTPLATLRGYIETALVGSAELPAELRDQLRIALRQADHLGRLIDSLFELARLEAGIVVPRIEPMNIAELLQDVALRFRMFAAGCEVELRTLLDTRNTVVLADVGLIERVIGNLLDNALRHTPRGGQVRIELTVEDRLARIRVVDSGEGIDAAHVGRVFERNYSLGAPGDRTRAGLGLSIVKHIIDLHGQQVTIRSRHGGGTVIEFTLGLAAGTPASAKIRPLEHSA